MNKVPDIDTEWIAPSGGITCPHYWWVQNFIGTGKQGQWYGAAVRLSDLTLRDLFSKAEPQSQEEFLDLIKRQISDAACHIVSKEPGLCWMGIEQEELATPLKETQHLQVLLLERPHNSSSPSNERSSSAVPLPDAVFHFWREPGV